MRMTVMGINFDEDNNFTKFMFFLGFVNLKNVFCRIFLMKFCFSRSFYSLLEFIRKSTNGREQHPMECQECHPNTSVAIVHCG